MSFQVSPGVAVSEVDLTAGVQQVSVSDAAFAGPFQWGPALEARSIGTEDELVSVFGKPDDTVAEFWFSAQSFLAYSNLLHVVRAVSSRALNSTPTPKAVTGTVDSGDGNTANVNIWSTHSGSGFVTTGLVIGQKVYLNDANVSHNHIFTISNILSNTVFATLETPNAVTNAASVSAYGVYIPNLDKYEQTYSDGVSGYGPWAAKYPGDLGNSLRVSTCSGAAAFSSSPTGNLSVIAGSNVVTGVGTSFTTDTQVGDYLILGSGQKMQIGTITNTTSVVCKTAALKTAAYSVWSRQWEFAAQFNSAPGTSNFVAARGGLTDEMHIVVVDNNGLFTGVPGTVLERYPFVSKASDAKDDNNQNSYYADVINQNSAYLWWLDDPATNVANFGTVALNHTFGVDALPENNTFLGGQTGNEAVDDSALELAYDIFKNGDLIDISLVITGPASAALSAYIIQNICEVRKDCVAFISPLKTNVVNSAGSEPTNIQSFRNSLPSSSYGFLDSGWKYAFDKYNDKSRWVPLNGDTAGIAARSDSATDPWFSPAGFNRGNVKNVLKLAWNPKQVDRDTIYKFGCNPVVSFPGQGTILYGDKTLLSRPSAFDRINVRRLFIILEKTVSRLAQASLFEFNDEFTRSQFRNIVEPYLRDVQSRRGITDYRVVCDESNNTTTVIDSNSFQGDIYVKPTRSINFITLNFVAVASGVSFQEVTGQQ